LKLYLKQRQPGDVLDKVFASEPVDRVARRVTQQPADEEAPSPPPPRKNPYADYTPNNWAECPPLSSLTKADLAKLRKGGTFINFTGMRLGKLRVIGLGAFRSTSQSGSKPTRWVVRCDCGYYEHRRTRTLRIALESRGADTGCCQRCQQTEWLRQQQDASDSVRIMAIDHGCCR
jgi:hypothetical protein